MKKLLATLALAIGAQAHAANMQFDGTVSTGCSLQVNQNGTLAIDPSTPYQLSTSAIGGLPGTVNVNYVGTPTVSVTLPTSFTTSPTLGFTPSFSGVVMSSSVGSLSVSNGVASHTYSNGSYDMLTVNLTINSGGAAFPLGAYSTVAVVNCS